eukprot:3366136-Pleurochrysis_carterae.AAC.1
MQTAETILSCTCILSAVAAPTLANFSIKAARAAQQLGRCLQRCKAVSLSSSAVGARSYN